MRLCGIPALEAWLMENVKFMRTFACCLLLISNNSLHSINTMKIKWLWLKFSDCCICIKHTKSNNARKDQDCVQL